MRRLAILCAALLAALSVLSAQTGKSDKVLVIDGRNYYLHTMARSDTFASVAAAYGVSESVVSAANPTAGAKTPVIRIPCYDRISRLAPRRSDDRFVRYKIRKGDSFFSVASQNAISVDTLLADNPGVDITDISDRSTLNVRISAAGITPLSVIRTEFRSLAEALNMVSVDYRYHVVEHGQTLYSLGKSFGLTPDELLDLNGKLTVLNEGMIIKIPAHKFTKPAAVEPTVAQDVVAEKADDSDDAREFAGEWLNVSVLLPLTDNDGKVRGSFVEFYQGALLAAEDLKKSGLSVELNLFDTGDSSEQTERIVNDRRFRSSDLIIGPVYERNAGEVIDFARYNSIPLVSPLAQLEGRYGRFVYQMSPVQDTRLDKLRAEITPQTNVVFVYTASTDSEMEQEMKEAVGAHPYSVIRFNRDFDVISSQGTLEDLINGTDNLFVVLSNSGVEVDRVLAKISSIMNNRQARTGVARVPMRVVGHSRWMRYGNLDKNLLFKLDVMYLANYHADRGNDRVADFDSRYLNAFGRMPSLYSYRGYDVLKLFGHAMAQGGKLTTALNSSDAVLLQMPYKFVLNNSNMVNTQWALVIYGHDYTITVR